MRRLFGIASALMASLCLGQQQASFDLATIKPTADKTNQFMLRRPENGLFRATGVTLKMLIMSAYDVQAFQVSGGPSWIGTERWDIQAKAEGGQAGFMPRDQFDAMLRTLLEERFQLKVRSEAKEMAIYELAVAKSGAKVTPHTGDAPRPGEALRMGYGSLRFQKANIARLAFQLSVQLGRAVIDKTGLADEYDFTLEWAPEPGQGGPETLGLPPDLNLRPPPVDPNRPSIFTAVQEQLGLRLDSAKGPVDMIFIESLVKPSEN